MQKVGAKIGFHPENFEPQIKCQETKYEYSTWINSRKGFIKALSFLCFLFPTGRLDSSWQLRVVEYFIYLEVVNRGCSNAFCINPFHLSRHQIFNYLQNPTAAAFTEFEHYWYLNPVLHPAISQLIWNVGLWELHATDSVIFERAARRRRRVNYSAAFLNFCFSKRIIMKHI